MIYSDISNGFNNPYGIAADNPGNIWITNPTSHTVTQIPRGSHTEQPILYSGEKYGFSRPYGITVDQDANIWIANMSGSVTKLPGGDPIAEPIIFESRWGFERPTDIAVDAGMTFGWLINWEIGYRNSERQPK